MPKTYADRIAELQQRQAQLRAQEKRLRAKQNEAERKARTHRLIQIGATVESVLGRPIDENELPKLIAFLKRSGYGGSYFLNAMSKSKGADGTARMEEDILYGDYDT